MNPKPLLSLNHFTVPCSISYYLLFSKTQISEGLNKKKAAKSKVFVAS
jgi:hypothetical protein